LVNIQTIFWGAQIWLPRNKVSHKKNIENQITKLGFIDIERENMNKKLSLSLFALQHNAMQSCSHHHYIAASLFKNNQIPQRAVQQRDIKK
jgi:hypothetical protein